MLAKDIGAIDFMNYLMTPEATKDFNKNMEGELVCKMQASIPGGWPSIEEEELIRRMDEGGVETVFISDCKMFSYWSKKILMDNGVDKVGKFVMRNPKRFVGLAGYNPYKIMESLKDIEKGVKEYNFKGVYVHIFGFDMYLTDPRMYPLYAKCVELDIPVSMQVGYVLEAQPSKFGFPYQLDEIAVHFPELKLVGAHTGYPWVEELLAISFKWDNIYVGIDAHMPKYMDPSIIKFINTRGQDQVVWGTNGLLFKTVLEDLDKLELRDIPKKKLLRDNAIKLYKLDK